MTCMDTHAHTYTIARIHADTHKHTHKHIHTHTNTYTNTPGHVKAADSADSSEPNPTMHVVFCPAAATSATTSGAVSEPGVGLAIWATGHCGQGTAAHMYASMNHSKLSGAREQQGARARQKTCIAGTPGPSTLR